MEKVMKTFVAILFAAVMGLSAVTAMTVPVQAAEKAAVQKCDKAGNPCTEGKGCTVGHCKAQKKSTKAAPKK